MHVNWWNIVFSVFFLGDSLQLASVLHRACNLYLQEEKKGSGSLNTPNKIKFKCNSVMAILCIIPNVED